MKSMATIRRHKTELRELIDASDADPIVARIAYAMETALLWVSQPTRGWLGMRDEAIQIAECLKRDLANIHRLR